MSSIPVLRNQRQMSLYEFETNLVSRVEFQDCYTEKPYFDKMKTNKQNPKQTNKIKNPKPENIIFNLKF